MKKCIYLFLICVVHITCVHAHAAESVYPSHGDKTVYYLPELTVSMSIYDMEEDGGAVLVSSEYDSEDVEKQVQKISRQYPGYQIHRLTGELVGGMTVRLIPLNKVIEAAAHTSSVGPYFNAEFDLTRKQVKELQALLESQRASELIAVDAPLVVRYSENVILEEYQTSSDICYKWNVKEVEDLIFSLGAVKQPNEVQLPSTFIAWKKDVLANCFQLNNASQGIQSFKELLGLNVMVRPKKTSLLGSTREIKDVTQTVQLGIRMKQDDQRK